MNSIILKSTKDSNTAIAQEKHFASLATNTRKMPSSQESIRVGLRDVASENALVIKQLAQKAVEQALQMGKRLLQMNNDLKRKEYKVFLQFIGWTTHKARKYINLAKTFADFELSQLAPIELTTLLSLTASRYLEVVEKLREMPDLTQQKVEQLMKQCRDRKKPSVQYGSGWKQCRSGGGRYYNILLHDEHTGMSIEQQAQNEGVLPHKIIADAVAKRAQHTASIMQPDEDLIAQKTQLTLVVEKERSQAFETKAIFSSLESKEQEHNTLAQNPSSQSNILQTISILREEEQRIKTINVQIQDCASKLAQLNLSKQVELDLRNKFASLKKLQTTKISQLLTLAKDKAIPIIYEHLYSKGRIILDQEYAIARLWKAKTWEEVALIVGCDRNYLLKIAKAWTIEQRQLLVKLLSDYLTREPLALNQVSWVSKNLLDKALSNLSFILKKIDASDNLAARPKIEHINGCCFVTIQNFSTKYEQ
jgi:hypothetical protein